MSNLYEPVDCHDNYLELFDRWLGDWSTVNGVSASRTPESAKNKVADDVLALCSPCSKRKAFIGGKEGLNIDCKGDFNECNIQRELEKPHC